MNALPRPRSDLREYQRFISDLFVERSAVQLISAMGSGKTAGTLDALVRLIAAGEVRRVLIIAPLLVASTTWPDEIEAWAHTRDLTYAVVVGEPEARVAALEAGAQITIINRENLVWLAKHLGSVRNWPFDCVVVDESSMFKAGKKKTVSAKVKVRVGERWRIAMEPPGRLSFEDRRQAQRFHKTLARILGVELPVERFGGRSETRTRKGGNITRFGVLAMARQKIKRIYLLTGTPGEAVDQWGPTYLLDQGERLGRTMTAFHNRWFIKDRYRHTIEPRPGAVEEITKRISDVTVSLPPLKIVPDPVYIPVRVDLSKKVMLEYQAFEKTLFSEIHDVEAVSKGVLANKLLQFANGSMYREDGSVAKIHGAKLDALDELIEQAAGDPVLVFYSFKFDLDEIRRRHPKAVVLNEASDAVRDWNAGKIRILLAHPASCAHGLNMQYGGHIAIWFGLIWSLELYLQANARLPRPGQKNLVAIYQIIATGTYDERALGVLAEKNATQNQLIESVMCRLHGC